MKEVEREALFFLDDKRILPIIIALLKTIFYFKSVKKNLILILVRTHDHPNESSHPGPESGTASCSSSATSLGGSSQLPVYEWLEHHGGPAYLITQHTLITHRLFKSNLLLY